MTAPNLPLILLASVLACASFAAPAGDGGSRGACQETFEDAGSLPGPRWQVRNNSQPGVGAGWVAGDAGQFPAASGSPSSYLAAHAQNGAAVTSKWLITPILQFSAGNRIGFLTRSLGGAGSAQDRLAVRVCMLAPGIDCTHVGAAPGDTGQFGGGLLWVNPNAAPGGYPASWTVYTITAAHGLPTSGHGRIAFQYYASTNGGAGSTIGIDDVAHLDAMTCAFSDYLFEYGFENPMLL